VAGQSRFIQVVQGGCRVRVGQWEDVGQSSRTSRSPASWPAGAGRWPPSSNPKATTPTPKTAGRRSGAWQRVTQTRAWAYEQQRFSLPRSPSRQAETLQPNSPSCGIQPANISSDRAVAKTRSRPRPPPGTHTKQKPAQKKTLALLPPAHLTGLAYVSGPSVWLRSDW
jgi:hypothetical protein